MDFSKLVDSIKLSPKYLFAIFIAGLLFLIAPASILGRMSLNDFWLRPYIGIATLLSAALLLAHGVTSLIDRSKAKRAKREEDEAWQRRVVETLAALTRAEKEALRPYIVEDRNTALFKITDGVAGGLVAKGIIYQATAAGYWLTFSYNLQPWARDHLSKHPELLEE